MKILNEYKTHHYIEDYEKSDYFCPFCGKQEVYNNQGPGDYYVGSDSLCINCNSSLYLNFCTNSISDNYLKKIDQLKTKVSSKPSTPEGD